MAYNYEWWTPSGIIPHTKATGIRIANQAVEAPYRGRGYTGALTAFANEVKRCLGYIYLTTCGQTMLDFLNVCNRVVSIDPATYGMGYINLAGGSPLKEIVSIASFGKKRQLYGVFNSGNYSVVKFINEFNRIPVYRQDFTPHFDWDSFRQRVVKTDFSYAVIPEAQSALEWVRAEVENAHVHKPSAEHTKNSLILMLYECSNRGPGSNVLVLFNEAATDEENIKDRPSSIGLAHELIHAYYSVQGLQPSAEDGLLDDLICIGLGPWFGEAISDNTMRTQWNSYVYSQIPSWDNANKVRVAYRTSHADIGKYVFAKHSDCVIL
jgi:Effector protein